MNPTLTHEHLKKKQRSLRDDHFPKDMALRVHRSISWVGSAEGCKDDDFDAKFIFLWIAFNAAYADEREFDPKVANERPPGERKAFMTFFKKIKKLDKERVVFNAIWHEFPGPVRNLMNNRFVFSPFWHCMHGKAEHKGWKKDFENSRKAFHQAFSKKDEPRILSMIFDRLYVLRNQILHGGSTWNSKVNRDQLRDGANILGTLMPVFIDIMMNNPSEDWGRPFYPVTD